MTMVLTMIAALLSAALLLPMRICYKDERIDPVGCLNAASTHNFGLAISFDLFQDVLHETVHALLVPAFLRI